MAKQKVKLEDGSSVNLKRKFDGKTYNQTGNGAGKISERRELMSKTEASKLAKDYRKRGINARVVKHGSKYLLYTKFGR